MTEDISNSLDEIFDRIIKTGRLVREIGLDEKTEDRVLNNLKKATESILVATKRISEIAKKEDEE